MGDDARYDHVHVHAFEFVGSPQRLPDQISQLPSQPLELRGPIEGPPSSPFQSLPEAYG